MTSDKQAESNAADLAKRAREALERSLGTTRPDPTDPPDAERLRRMQAVVQSLPRRQRDIFLAVRLDNMSYAQIAERTGLSRQAIQRHFADALSHIHHRMTYGSPPPLIERVRRWFRWR